ncbi:MAG: penicillin acylase family protein [Chlorobi bacterium]|nr:penicillin acylase family protein [Chlorobiota bacterium]
MQYNLPQQRSRHIVAAILTALVISAGLLIFGVSLALRSPASDETIAAGRGILGDSVEIYRNDFGIAHIVARNDEDAFVALGYLHASDRLWQMELYRRIALGRLAEIFGDDFVRTDVFFRTLSLGEVARNRIYPALSEESKRVLKAYTRGINLFIAEHRYNRPFEFDALGFAPEPWQESDCLAIGRLMAFDMSMSFWTDIVLGEIADRHGVARALQLIPNDAPNSPRVLGAAERSSMSSADGWHSEWQNERFYTTLESIGAAYLDARRHSGASGNGSGSNSWAVRITTDGQPDALLANDPHLVLGLPARWYHVHISSPSFNVVGATIPGLPAVLSGRNDAIAWGITNVMLDDCDYFIERQDTTRSNAIVVGNTRRKLRIRYDTIAIRNRSPIVIAVRSNGDRPIVSDAHVTARPDTVIGFPPLRSGVPLTSRYLVSVSWTGYIPSDEIRSLLGIMRARTWSQFRAALRWWGSPALNFTYADLNGNIGIQPAGIVPLRGKGHPNIPSPGWDTTYGWRGVMHSPFPSVYNPSAGYVLSANNKTGDSIGFFVSNLWEPSSRAERIAQLLAMGSSRTVRDAQLMQLDLASPYALQLLGIVRPVLDTSTSDTLQRHAIDLLSRWDGYMLSASGAAALYSVFLERLMNVVFRVHLQEDEYLRYAFIGSMPMRRLTEVLLRPTEWFDADSATAERMRNRAIRQAFSEAVEKLVRIAGTSPAHWQWGDLHRLTLNHPLATVRAYRSLLERTVTGVGGDATTIANGLWRIHRPFAMVIGASMRSVTRLRDTVVYAIVPGGTSGNPFSNNFSDQLTLWANGGLLPIPLHRAPQPTWKRAILLVPQSVERR